MQNWLYENWMQAITLAAVVIAAIGAICSAIIGWSQYRYMKRYNQRKSPAVHCQVTTINSQKNWRQLHIDITNMSDTGIDIISATFAKPSGIKLRGIQDAFESDRFGVARMRDPLPEQNLEAVIYITKRLQPLGAYNARELSPSCVSISLLAYNPAIDYPEDCSIRLTLRWRDESAKTFTIDAAITTAESKNVATV